MLHLPILCHLNTLHLLNLRNKIILNLESQVLYVNVMFLQYPYLQSLNLPQMLLFFDIQSFKAIRVITTKRGVNVSNLTSMKVYVNPSIKKNLHY